MPSGALHALEQVARQFAPEDINDDRATAPSRRIELVVPSFRKRLHGPAIAKEIGLDAIRAACPASMPGRAGLRPCRTRIRGLPIRRIPRFPIATTPSPRPRVSGNSFLPSPRRMRECRYSAPEVLAEVGCRQNERY
ncbi:DUF4276 family protein [Candidatus Poriferisodalis sp.]|uniref:DUF4276 family protein n=1 Tax=Candidatus Poriferisodalis sp. TaxID=3101277 RepID=UPI003B02CFE5